MSTVERKVKEKEERRNMILDAAEQHFSAAGYDQVTMDDVAQAAKLAKGTLYLYFRNKESLYVGVVTRGVAVLGDMIEQSMAGEKKGLSKAYAAGLAYYEFSKKYPVYFDMLIDAEGLCLSETVGEAIRKEFSGEQAKAWQITVEAVRLGLADGTIRPEAEPAKTALFLIESTRAMIKASLGAHLLLRRPVSRDEFVYFGLDMLKHAIENKGDHR